MTLSNGIWISRSYSGDTYIKWLIIGKEAVVLSSKNSGWMKGDRTSNNGWDGGILTRWSTKHYYKLL